MNSFVVFLSLALITRIVFQLTIVMCTDWQLRCWISQIMTQILL